MKLNKYILTLPIILVVFILTIIQAPISASNKNQVKNEDTSDNGFDIKWIGKISTADDIKQGKGFFKKVFEFVAGKDYSGLVKPVNLIAIDTGKYIIADQGIRFPVYIDVDNGSFQNIEGDMSFYPSLIGICRGKGGAIYFTDSKLNKIFYLNSFDSKPLVFNDSLALLQPTGIAYSSQNDEIWISETAEHRLLILDNKGNVKKFIGKRGTEPGEFNFPTFLWIDNSGKVYVVDAMNFRIQIFSKDGEVLSVFGEAGDATGFISSPKGIATDSYGHIYLVDALFHSVQVFDEKGNFLYYFGLRGTGDGQFWMPSGIYIDKYDRIYIADSYNSRIQIFQLLKRERNEK